MSDTAGYTLDLYCDCEDCKKYPEVMVEAQFATDGEDCRSICYAIAELNGWEIGFVDGERLAFAKGHMSEELRKDFKRLRIPNINKWKKYFTEKRQKEKGSEYHA